MSQQNPVLSSRLSSIKPSATVAITARVNLLKAQGKDVIGLGAGEPDFDTPKHIARAGIEAIETGKTRYVASAGIMELRKAIVSKFKRDNNLDYDVEQVTVGVGAKQLIFNALCATINSGDEVVIPAPYWVSYPDITLLFGGKPVIVHCTIDNDFKITPKQLEEAISPKTKWFVFNTPSNPTGAGYSKEEIKALGEVLKRHPHVHIMSDDIYEFIVYDDYRFCTIASVMPELQARTLTINGVSKAYCMTGWRIGYAAGPVDLIRAINILNSQSTSSAATMTQWAAVEALNGNQDSLEEHRKVFLSRRNFVIDSVNAIKGMKCNVPNGAFYVYPSIREVIGTKTPGGSTLNTDTDFVEYLLNAKGVATIQGKAFGLSPYFRISYATSDENLREALKRIKHAVDDLR